MLQLSRMFLDVELDYKYSFITPGEGRAGHLIIQDGHVVYRNEPEMGSFESHQISFYVLNFDAKRSFELRNGNYKIVTYSHISGDRFDYDRVDH